MATVPTTWRSLETYSFGCSPALAGGRARASGLGHDRPLIGSAAIARGAARIVFDNEVETLDQRGFWLRSCGMTLQRQPAIGMLLDQVLKSRTQG